MSLIFLRSFLSSISSHNCRFNTTGIFFGIHGQLITFVHQPLIRVGVKSSKMKILVTGGAGFIGYHTCKKLILAGHNVIGLDNINSYYDPKLKLDRIQDLGISDKLNYGTIVKSTRFGEKFHFVKCNLEDYELLNEIFQKEGIAVVCHLGAQAGVRHSIEDPFTYIQSNIVGFMNVLECARHHQIRHLVYASSSSVYGKNSKIPFHIDDRTDQPISIYAATKKSNELMAYTYSHLYNLRTTGLRFFTVYGPWGRPDMALFLFAKAIAIDEPIKVFNHGDMARDFTYIEDIVEGITRIIEHSEADYSKDQIPFHLYNIGNNKPVKLMDFVRLLEEAMGRKAKLNFQPIQPGDVPQTWANVEHLKNDYNFNPDTPLRDGVTQFVSWFKDYYQLN